MKDLNPLSSFLPKWEALMSKHVYLYSKTLSAEDLGALVERYHSAYGLPASVRMSAPDVTAQLAGVAGSSR
jgi:hypothetical protein